MKQILVAGSLSLMASGVVAAEAATGGTQADVVAEGKKLAFDKKKGNCLACHEIEGGAGGGNIGPVLLSMGARFPDKARLRAQIWDATKLNPNTMMPPFGRHQILSDDEIDKIVEFVHTL